MAGILYHDNGGVGNFGDSHCRNNEMMVGEGKRSGNNHTVGEDQAPHFHHHHSNLVADKVETLEDTELQGHSSNSDTHRKDEVSARCSVGMMEGRWRNF